VGNRRKSSTNVLSGSQCTNAEILFQEGGINDPALFAYGGRESYGTCRARAKPESLISGGSWVSTSPLGEPLHQSLYVGSQPGHLLLKAADRRRAGNFRAAARGIAFNEKA